MRYFRLLLICVAACLLAQGVKWWFAKPAKKAAAVVASESPTPTPSPTPAPVSAPVVVEKVRREVVRVRGVLRRGERVQVLLSDGRVLTENTGGLESIDRAGVVVEGERLWYVVPVDPSPTPAQGVQAAAITGADPVEAVPFGEADPEKSSWRRDRFGTKYLVDRESLNTRSGIETLSH